ncbi:MAG: hypothetical protein ACI9Y8_002046 [Candidatus Omnitrophota bacterium]|jgi:hypothetical protein
MNKEPILRTGSLPVGRQGVSENPCRKRPRLSADRRGNDILSPFQYVISAKYSIVKT